MGLALHDSLMSHAKPFHLWILCMDELLDRQLTELRLAHVSLIPLKEVETDGLLRAREERSLAEYCWTLTPFIFQEVFKRSQEANRVTYVDADLFFFDDPRLLLAELDENKKDVLITDHAYAPEHNYAKKYGRFAVQFVTFKRSDSALKVMKWWQDRCIEWCFDRVENGKFGDQKYLDVWPDLFAKEVQILKQVEKTLAPWNVRHFLDQMGEDEKPVFYHFHGLRILDKDRLRLFKEFRVGGRAMRFYDSYLDALWRGFQILEFHNIPLPSMPLPREKWAGLKHLKRLILRRREHYTSLKKLRSTPTIDGYKRRPGVRDRIQGGLRTQGRIPGNSSSVRPLVSITTVVHNGVRFLERAILSVLNQTYENIEYIIVDGGSTDGTLRVIEKYEKRIAYWISERDAGISDAFNKGIAASTGEIIGLLNADDWLSPDQVERGVDGLEDLAVDFVFGDLQFHDSSGELAYTIHGDPDYKAVIERRMPDLCHPTVLAKRTAYERIGLFRTEYRYAMDYEWFLRLHKRGGSGKYVKGILGHMRIAGKSDELYREALKEVRNIAIEYGRSRWGANLFFLWGVVKGLARRGMEKRGWVFLYRQLWRIINKRYSPV